MDTGQDSAAVIFQ